MRVLKASKQRTEEMCIRDRCSGKGRCARGNHKDIGAEHKEERI